MPAPPSQPGRLGLKGWLYAGRYGPERYLYALQRLSGLGLLLFLCLHLIVTAARLWGPAAWATAMSFTAIPLIKLGEFAVVAGFVFHGVNGLRLALLELGFLIGRPSRQDYPYTTSVRRQRPAMLLAMTLVALLLLVSGLDFYLI